MRQWTEIALACLCHQDDETKSEMAVLLLSVPAKLITNRNHANFRHLINQSFFRKLINKTDIEIKLKYYSENLLLQIPSVR